MDESKDRELWAEICFDLHTSVSGSLSEELYEQKILMTLDKMGWKQFNGEVILKKNIPVGSAQSIIPDIIVKSEEKNISFVIEVKKPSINLVDDRYRNQLFSYMRQLKLDFGILIGEKIQIFYDGALESSNNPIQIKSIDFTKEDINLDFVKVFRRDNISLKYLEEYANIRISKIKSKKQSDELGKYIQSSGFKERVHEVITEILLENWDEETVKNASFDLHMTVSSIQPESISQVITQQNQTTIYNNSGEKVEYIFYPPDESEFKKQLLQSKFAHIKIIFQNGREEYKTWNASRFTEDSNLRGNINSKTWFRQDYVQKYGVVKAIFSIKPL